MAHVRTIALVLRRTDFSETSLVLAALTRDLGRVSMLVKGAKRPKSPFLGALDLYSLNDVVFLERRSGGLGILTEAHPLELYLGLRETLKRAYAAHAVAELLLGLLEEDEPVPEIFDLTLGALDSLTRAGDEQVEVFFAMFQVRLLKPLGYDLVLDRCALCGKAREPTAQEMAFSVTSGGVVCRDCSARAPEHVSVSAGAVKVLANLGSGPSNMVARMRLTGRIRRDVRGLLTRMYSHLLGRAPRMAQYL